VVGSLLLQRAVQYALHAYDATSDAFLEMGFTSAERVQRGVTAGWLVSCPGSAVLATAGTVGPGTQPRNLLQWLSHVDFRQQDIGGGQKVHSLWYQQAQGYLGQVLIACSNQGVTSLSLAGHSYGGSISQLLANLLASEGITVESVYSFGAPRSGNSAWAGAFPTSEVFRVERGNDPVPWVPWSVPQWLLALAWQAYLGGDLVVPHGQFAAQYDPAGKLVWCPDQVLAPRLVTDPLELSQLTLQRLGDLLGSFSHPILSIQAAQDHSIVEYAAHCNTQLGA